MTKQATSPQPAVRTAASQRILAMTYTALFVVVLAVCSWITIPLTVPFTLQTFAVYMALLLLGGRRGTLAIGIYLMLGALGVPVFAGFAGGLGSLLGPTGGYLIGFLVMGFIYWAITGLAARIGNRDQGPDGSGMAERIGRIAGILFGIVLCYVFGTAWFLYVYAAGGEAVSLMTALSWCVFPFLLPEAGKLLLAFSLAPRLRRFVQ